MREPQPATAPDQLTEAEQPRGWRRGFWCLMATQFQNAFSDNALKQLIILVLLASAAASAGDAEQDRLVSLVTAVFSAPTWKRQKLANDWCLSAAAAVSGNASLCRAGEDVEEEEEVPGACEDGAATAEAEAAAAAAAASASRPG